MAIRERLSRLAPWSWIPALFFWAAAVVVWVDRLLNQAFDPDRTWLYDWHVYAAGARDFLAGDLYRVPLQSPFPLPVNAFNMPPGSALVVVPFEILPPILGGPLWVILNLGAVAAAAVLTARIVNLRPVWLWSGAAFLAYSVSEWALAALIGNNTPLLLLMVAGFVTAHLASRSVLAGALLGLAIATKLWPAAYLVVLARERSWKTFGWAAGIAITLLGGSLIWLGGLDVVGPMVAALSADVEPGPNQLLLGISWLRFHTDWWPEWGGYAVAVLVLLIPATGLTGYGLATLAGLSAIPNVWRHYLGTVVFGFALLVRGLYDRFGDRVPGPFRRSREATSPSGTFHREAADRL